ncbi:MAG: thiamine pyrophosphate-requiring protein [Pseudomonadota bacterium]
MTMSDDADQVTAGAALFLRLRALGVDMVFCNAGTDFPPIIEGLAEATATGAAMPEAVLAPHEHAAMGMAHGYYLASGRPQAVILHTNVGLANGAIGALNAATAQVPILLMSGRTSVVEKGRFGARTVPIAWGQEMRDQAALVREAVKWDYELRYPEQLVDLLDRALAIARSSPPGPVYLSLPLEVLCEPCPAAKLERPPAMLSTARAPDAALVRQVAEALAAAERPLVIAQRGAGSAAAFAALAELLDRWAIPISHYWATELAVPSLHPTNVGQALEPFLQEADVVVVLDGLAPWSPDRGEPAPDAMVVQIAPDPLFQRTPIRNFRSDVALAGDVDRTVLALADAMAEQRPETLAVEARRHRVTAAVDDLRRARAEADASDTPLTKGAVARILSAAIAACDPVVFSELGCPLDSLDLRRHDAWHQEPHAGGLGWSFPAALGFKLAQRQRLVVATMGDGSYVFANPVACHQIAAALGVPVLVVVLNNAEWHAVRRSVVGLYPEGHAAKANRVPLTSLAPSPDFATVARASGAFARTVEDATGLRRALNEALTHLHQEPSLALLDVRIA